MRARVTVLDRSPGGLAALDAEFDGAVATQLATAEVIEAAVLQADLVIGAVLLPGAAAPRLVTGDMVSRMRTGSLHGRSDYG
jgi:alanine dehydrogenase